MKTDFLTELRIKSLPFQATKVRTLIVSLQTAFSQLREAAGGLLQDVNDLDAASEILAEDVAALLKRKTRNAKNNPIKRSGAGRRNPNSSEHQSGNNRGIR